MATLSIIAIHGTFAADAPWTKPDSTFARMLERELPDMHIRWHFYNWSGANSHKAREEAASGLESKLAELHRDGEENIHIIGHSHGGNVALMTQCALQKKASAARSVVCLSTPFFIVSASDIEYLLGSIHDSLRLKPLLLMSLLYFVLMATLSGFAPLLAAIGMVLYLLLLPIAAGTAMSLYALRGSLSQRQILERYDYARIREPILSLRTTYDEAFHLLSANSTMAKLPSLVFWAVSVAAIVGIPLALLIGWIFVLPLIILSPLIYISAQGLRYLVRAAPWAMGEGFLQSTLANFATKNSLDFPNARNLEVKITAAETHRQLKLRHSALYSSEAAAKDVAFFIRAASG